jgi:cytochrome P450
VEHEPFSAGARGCIGGNISYLEQTVFLASVAHRYEMALPHEWWKQERWEVFDLMPGPLPLKVWGRELGVEA